MVDRAAYLQGILGRPYDEATAHCWWLTALVQRELYGRSVPGSDEPLPAQDDRARMLREGVEAHGWQEHADPADGDIVMMSRFAGGPREHCGVYIAGRGVLHTDRPHGVVIDTLTELRHVRLWRPSFFRPA